MSLTRRQTGTFLVIVLVLVLTACGGSDDASSGPTAPPATQAPESVATPVPTQPQTEVEEQPTRAVEEEVVPAVEDQPTPAEEAEPEDKIPFDVPVMDGAIDVLIETETGSVTYVVQDTEIEDAIEFYQTSMAESGWENVTTSAVGLMATLVFETDQARTSVSLQANNVAKMVTVRLFILEK
jgi:hypothetical protein